MSRIVCDNCGGQRYTDMGRSVCAVCLGAGFETTELRAASVVREAERMNAELDRLTMLRAFQGARRLAKRKRDPNWVFAMEMFGFGSTYAWAMCERMGVDPDSTSVEPRPDPASSDRGGL